MPLADEKITLPEVTIDAEVDLHLEKGE